jgi:hypothetical protein
MLPKIVELDEVIVKGRSVVIMKIVDASEKMCWVTNVDIGDGRFLGVRGEDKYEVLFRTGVAVGDVMRK